MNNSRNYFMYLWHFDVLHIYLYTYEIFRFFTINLFILIECNQIRWFFSIIKKFLMLLTPDLQENLIKNLSVVKKNSSARKTGHSKKLPCNFHSSSNEKKTVKKSQVIWRCFSSLPGTFIIISYFVLFFSLFFPFHISASRQQNKDDEFSTRGRFTIRGFPEKTWDYLSTIRFECLNNYSSFRMPRFYFYIKKTSE